MFFFLWFLSSLRRTVRRHVLALLIHDAELAGGDQLNPRARLDDPEIRGSELLVLRPRLADRDERRGFGQPVYLGDVPTEIAFHAFDRRRRRRRSGRDHVHSLRNIASNLGGSVGEPDQNRRRGAKPADPLLADQVEDSGRLHLRQADVRSAHRGDDPHESPAVGVEHRQGPQVAVADRYVKVDQGAHDVCPCVSVRDHHALRLGGRAARVVQGEEVALGDVRTIEVRLRLGEDGLVLHPAFPAARRAEADEMLHSAQLVPNAVDGVEVIRVDAHHLCPRVPGDIDEVLGGQAVVDRHQDSADLGHRIEGFELLVGVRRDVCDPVALLHPHRLQRRRPAVAAIQELLVGQPQIAVDDRLTIAVELPCPSREVERSERGLHALIMS